jgi:hypothetical protein
MMLGYRYHYYLPIDIKRLYPQALHTRGGTEKLDDSANSCRNMEGTSS